MNLHSKSIKLVDSLTKAAVIGSKKDVCSFPQAEGKLEHYVVARSFSQTTTMTAVFRPVGIIEMIGKNATSSLKIVVFWAISKFYRTRIGHENRSKVKFSGARNERLSLRVFINRRHYRRRGRAQRT